MPHLADAWKQYELSPLNGLPDRRKVCIYGAGIGKHEAPLGDPEWEVWGLNLVPPLYRSDGRVYLRADVWFDLHQRKAQTADDMRWIAECPFPIYVPPDLMDASPRALRYPLEEIEEAFGCYWTCTFAYQIALVMYLNTRTDFPFTDLGLYGVELAYGTERERTFEWACTAYWLGRAEQSGIRIHLPVGSLLGQHDYRYGFEYSEEAEFVSKFMRSKLESAGDVGGR